MTVAADESIPAKSARNAVANWLQYAIALVLALWLTPVIIRRVGAPAYGAWVLLLQLSTYAAMLDFGVPSVVVIRVAGAHARDDLRGLRPFLSTALAVGIGTGLVVLALAWLAIIPVLNWFNLGGVDPIAVQRTLFLLAVATALGFPLGFFNSVLAGLQRYDLVARFSIASQFLRGGLTLAFLWCNGGIVSLGAAWLTGTAAGLGLSCRAAYQETRAVVPSLHDATRGPLMALGSHGLYLFAGNLGWRLAYGTDALLVSAIFTARDTASFGVASSVLVLVMGVVAGFTGTLVPVATAGATLGDSEGGVRRYLAATRTALFLGLPLAAVLSLAGPELLSMWVGAETGLPAGRIVQVLAIAQIFLISNSAGVSFVLGLGLHRLAAGLTLLEGAFNLVLSYVLAARMGVIGVAVGTLIPTALLHGLVWPAIIRRNLSLGLQRYYKEALVPNAVSLTCAILAWSLTDFLHDSSSFGTVWRAVLFVCTYWMVGLRVCFSETERDTLRALLRRLTARRDAAA